MTAEARTAISRWFAGSGLNVEQVGDTWSTVLAGDHKRTIPVHLLLGTRALAAQSFFLAAPDEPAGVHELLLRRNLVTDTVRFALSDDGDVLLLGSLPLAAITEDELDLLMGRLLAVADDTYDAALRAGFPSYIEREQAWRATVGLPRNPIT